MAESLEKDRWSSCISSLKKELECPVCLDTVKPPVRLCGTGHICCSSCAAKLSRCSLCNENFLANSPVSLNNILQVLPRPCKYSQEGCNELCVSEDQHEIYCGFRSVLCRDLNCKDKVQVFKLTKHLEEKHRLAFAAKGLNGGFHFTPFNPHGTKKLWYTPIIVDEVFNYIYMFRDKANEGWEMLFETYFTKKPAFDYFVNVTLKKGDFITTHTLPAVNNEGETETNPFNEVTKTVKKNKTECMRVSPALLKHLLEEDNKLSVTYSFFKKDV